MVHISLIAVLRQTLHLSLSLLMPRKGVAYVEKKLRQARQLCAVLVL